MKKKTINILTIILIILGLFFTTAPHVKAAGLDDIITEADNFIKDGDKNIVDEDKILNTSQLIYNLLMVAGIIVAIIWGIILGIRFVGGAITEKAEVKKEVLIYIFGCAIILGATTIWKLVIDLASNALS